MSQPEFIQPIDSKQDTPRPGDGVTLESLPVGAILHVQTRNRTYEMEYRGDNRALISGHPEYCPGPVLVLLQGSVSRPCTTKPGCIGLGMSLEFIHPERGVMRTSRIQQIRNCGIAPSRGSSSNN